jgi:DNA mismatch repair protein MutS2
METHTLDILQFDKVRALVAEYAASELGKEAARGIEPGCDSGWIHEQLNLTTEMTEALGAGLSPPFGGLRDCRDCVRRTKTGAALDAEELATIVEVLHAVAALREWLRRMSDRFPRLGGLSSDVLEFEATLRTLESCLDARGQVLDTASRQLSLIRREIDQAEARIQDTLQRMLRSPEIKRILRFPNFSMVGHHYVLPIAREHRGEIQGSVHRTSASNETVYVEPQAIADQSAQLSYERVREQKEVRRILRWLSAQVGMVADDLLHSLAALAQLDLVAARARYSRDYSMTPPDLNPSNRLVLRSARHPLLEHVFRQAGDESSDASARRQVVPIDVHLGLESHILVVTGPNTGGKTVALKTVGLLLAMAHAGLHIPAAAGSQVPLVDNVLADIGDEQSIEQSLSTFSSHVRRLTAIFAQATKRSVVLLDEMGAGTDPAEGAALGRAVLDELDSVGCLALVTTHIGDLKTYALTNSNAENAAVEFDVETLRPLYHLRMGDVGQSNALKIARRLSFPEHVIARAERYLSTETRERTEEWDLVHKLRHEAEVARAAALAAEAESARLSEALQQRLADLQAQSQFDARLELSRKNLQPGDRVVVPRFGYDRPGRVVKLDPRKQTAFVAIGAMQWEVPIAEIIPQFHRAGGADS